MTDIAISVFSVSNRRGYFLPSLNIHYREVEGPQWTVRGWRNSRVRGQIWESFEG